MTEVSKPVFGWYVKWKYYWCLLNMSIILLIQKISDTGIIVDS